MAVLHFSVILAFFLDLINRTKFNASSLYAKYCSWFTAEGTLTHTGNNNYTLSGSFSTLNPVRNLLFFRTW